MYIHRQRTRPVIIRCGYDNICMYVSMYICRSLGPTHHKLKKKKKNMPYAHLSVDPIPQRHLDAHHRLFTLNMPIYNHQIRHFDRFSAWWGGKTKSKKQKRAFIFTEYHPFDRYPPTHTWASSIEPAPTFRFEFPSRSRLSPVLLVRVAFFVFVLCGKLISSRPGDAFA